MSFSLIGFDAAYDVTVCNLSVLGNLVLVYEETCVCYLDISYSLEKASYLICKCPCPFWFVGPLN